MPGVTHVLINRRLALSGLVAVLLAATLVTEVGTWSGAADTEPIVVSPAAGTTTASTSTQISLLGTAAKSVTSIVVTGSASGSHTGTLRRYASEPGESFLPTRPFQAGETVTVQVGVPLVGAPSGTYKFVVAQRVTVTPPTSVPVPHLDRSGVAHFSSAPTLDPPALTVTQGSGLGSTDLLLTPKGSVGNAGPEIADSTGSPIWFDPLHDLRAFDLNEQRLGRQPVLTWWQGVVVAAHGVGTDIVMNDSYKIVARISGGNGFRPDLHEFQLEPNDVAYVTSYQAVKWDMTSDGGVADGTVWDGVVQEIDVRTGLVMYEWHSLDHVGVSNSDVEASPSAGSILNYFHINSIQLLDNGDLLVSARNTSAVYEVSPRDGGSVQWELGGKASTFTMEPGSSFWYQHDAREVAPGIITLFDDEAAPAHAAESRALELRISSKDHTATVIRALQPPSQLLGVALGNTQELPDGDVFVSWGTTPIATQYSASGQVVFDETLPKGDDTYREYRDPWSATPTSRPSAALQRSPEGVDGEVSWNGATTVSQWRVLSGSTPGALVDAKSVVRTGFQTSFSLPASARFVAVEATGAEGQVLGTSATVAAP
ncbi:MAG TPA: arylsulfotransferase family protein [Acidimicrobiales bacterium]